MSQYGSKRQDGTKIYESNRNKIPLGASDKLTAKFANQEIPSKEQVSSVSRASSFSAGRWSSSRKNETTETEAESLLKSPKPSCIPSSGREVSQRSYGWSPPHSLTTSDRTSPEKITLGENYQQRSSHLTPGKMSNVPSFKHKGMTESSSKEDNIQGLKVGRYSDKLHRSTQQAETGSSYNIPLRASVRKSHDSDKNSDYGISRSSLHNSVSPRRSPTKSSSEPSNTIKKTSRIVAKDRLSGHHDMEMANIESLVSSTELNVNENNNDLKSLKKTFTPARVVEGSANQSFDRSDLKYNSCRSRIPTPNSPSSSHKAESPVFHKLSSQSFSCSRDSNSEINSEQDGKETNESRAERIARYKQIRRHELAAIIRAKLDTNIAEKKAVEDKKLNLKQNLNPEIAKEREPQFSTPSSSEKFNLNLKTESTESESPDLRLSRLQPKLKNVSERSKKRQERMLRNSQHLSAELIGQNAKGRILSNKLDTSTSIDSRNIPPSIADDTQPSLEAERAMGLSYDDRSQLAQFKSEEVGTDFTSNISSISSEIPCHKNISNQQSKSIGVKSEAEDEKSCLSLSNDSFIDKAYTKDLHTPLRKQNMQEKPNIIDTQHEKYMPQRRSDGYLTSGSETGYSDIFNYSISESDNFRNSNIDSESDIQIYTQMAADLNENPRSSTSFVKSKQLPASGVSYTKQLLKDLNAKTENKKIENEWRKDIDWLEHRKFEYMIKKAEKEKQFSVLDKIKAAEIKANLIRQRREENKIKKSLERTMSESQVKLPVKVCQETNRRNTNLERAQSFGSAPMNKIEEFLVSPKYESNLDELLLKNAAYLADEETDQSVRNLHPKENLKLRKSVRKKKLTKLASVTEKNNHTAENVEKEPAVTTEPHEEVSQIENYKLTKDSQDQDQESSSFRATSSSSERTLGANSPRYISSDFSSDTDKPQECYSYNKVNSQLERRRFRTRDKDTPKRSTLHDNVSDFSEDTSSSAQTLRDDKRVHRKRDKSSSRKSYLNISEDSEERDQQSEYLSVSDASTSNRTFSQPSDVDVRSSRKSYYAVRNLYDTSAACLEGKRVSNVTASESEKDLTSESERFHCNEKPKIPSFTKVQSTRSNAMDSQQPNISSIPTEPQKKDFATDHVQPSVYSSKNAIKLSNTAETTHNLLSGGLSIKNKLVHSNKKDDVDSTSKLFSHDARSGSTPHHSKEKLEKAGTDDLFHTTKTIGAKVAHKTPSVTTKNTDGAMVPKTEHAVTKSTDALGASKTASAVLKTTNSTVVPKTALAVRKTTDTTLAPKTAPVVTKATDTTVASKKSSVAKQAIGATVAPKTAPVATKAIDATVATKTAPVATKTIDATVAPKAAPVATKSIDATVAHKIAPIATKTIDATVAPKTAPVATKTIDATLVLKTAPVATKTIDATVAPKTAPVATKTIDATVVHKTAPVATKTTDATLVLKTAPVATKTTDATLVLKTAPVATKTSDATVAPKTAPVATKTIDATVAHKTAPVATKTSDATVAPKTAPVATKTIDATVTTKTAPVATKTIDATVVHKTAPVATKTIDATVATKTAPVATKTIDATVATKTAPVTTKTTDATLVLKTAPVATKTIDATVVHKTAPVVTKTIDATVATKTAPVATKTIDATVVHKTAPVATKTTDATLVLKTAPVATKTIDATVAHKTAPVATKTIDATVAHKAALVATVASKSVSTITNTSDTKIATQTAPTTTTTVSNTTLTLKTATAATKTVDYAEGPKTAATMTKTTCTKTSSTTVLPQMLIPTTKSLGTTMAPQTLPTAAKLIHTTMASKTVPTATKVTDSTVASQISSTATINTDMQVAQKVSYTATTPITAPTKAKTTDSKTTCSATKTTDGTATSKMTPIATTSSRITQTTTKTTDSIVSLKTEPVTTSVTGATIAATSKIMPTAINNADSIAISKTPPIILKSPETIMFPKVTLTATKTTDTTVTTNLTSSAEKTTDLVGIPQKLPTAGKIIDTPVVTTGVSIDPIIKTKQISSEPKTVTNFVKSSSAADSLTGPNINVLAAKTATTTVTRTSVALTPESTVVDSKIITTAVKNTDTFTITTTTKAPISKTTETVTVTKSMTTPTETLSTRTTDTLTPITKPTNSTGIAKSVDKIRDTDLAAVPVKTSETVEKIKAITIEPKAKETTKEINKTSTVGTSSIVQGTDNNIESIKSGSTPADINSTNKLFEKSAVNSGVTQNNNICTPTYTAADLDKTNILSMAQTNISVSKTTNISNFPTQTSVTLARTLESTATTKSIDTTDTKVFTKVLSSDTKTDIASSKIHDTKLSNVDLPDVVSIAKSDTKAVGLTEASGKIIDIKKTPFSTSDKIDKSSDISHLTSTNTYATTASSTLSMSTKTFEDNDENRDGIRKPATPDTMSQLYKHRRSEGSINTSHLSIHRGILKRASSLHRQNSCSEELDPELAKVFHSRRSKVDSEDYASEQHTSVFDENQFLRQDSLLTDVINEEPEEIVLSVSERICQMETQILSTSGATTPKTPRSRLGSVSRTYFEDSQKKSTLSEELFNKLSDLAHSKEAYQERRKKYQRGRDDWRSRTQPVTQEEVKEADNLETVSNFRALVMKRSSINIFEQLKDQEKQRKTFPGKKTEYPQPYIPEKKSQKTRERYKTLPVTAAELMAIPEGETVGLDNFKSTMQALREYKTDSGIVSSCSDFERDSQGSDSMRNLATDVDMEDDDITHLSVADRACIFQKLEEKSKKSASGAKRYIDRKKRERCKTQPVTEDEVKTASEIHEERVSDRKRNSITDHIEYIETSHETEETLQTLTSAPSLETLLQSENIEDDMELATHSDDLARQSLADKVKLFSSPKTSNEKANRSDAPVIRRRNRKVASRFNTQAQKNRASQPVTSEEMENVFRISPLAMSLVKPPDPEILKGLPLNAQRELVAHHAEACLSQQGSRANSRPGSQAGSRRGSLEEHEQSKLETNEILKMADIENNLDNKKNIHTVDLNKQHFDKEIKSTVKANYDMNESNTEQNSYKLIKSNIEAESRSVLMSKETKYHETHKKLSSEAISVSKLNKTDSESVQTTSITSITTKEHRTMLIKDQNGDQPRGILKKDSSFDLKTEDTVKNSLNNYTNQPSLENLNNVYSTPEPCSYKKQSMSAKLVSRSLSYEETKGNENQNTSERYLDQPPVEIPTDKTPCTPRKHLYTSRQHLTEPVTSFEKKEASDVVETVVKLSGSVAERDNSPQMSVDDLGLPANRLEALKKSGEHDWKKRVYKQSNSSSPSPDREVFKARSPSPLSTPVRPINLSERMSQLKSSQTSWKNRVEESDAQLFTVAGKLIKSGCVVREKTVLSQLHQKSFTESDDSGSVTSPTSPTKTEWKIPKPTEIISSEKHIDIEDNETNVSTIVYLPDMASEGLDNFFGCSTNVLDTSETLDLNVEDFDAIFMNSQNVLMHNVKSRPKKNVQARNKNPLKSRSVNLEKKEYQEYRTNIAEMEMKRIKKEIISKDAGFAEAALAGLASKENFSKIELRKTDISNPSPGSNRHLPYKPLMLFQIKGRRHVQTRLVEPCAKSVNHGDCYVLVTSDKVINWAGEFSNVIEKAKSADIAAHVQQKKDIGYKSTAQVMIIDSKKTANPLFWNLLQGSSDDCQECGLPDEDELYETAIISTNMIYKIEKNCLKPYEEYWGDSPKHEMLKNNEVLVFDFGCELYVWQGKKASPTRKKLGLELAQQLWNKGYYNESSRINQMSPLKLSSESDLDSANCSRPNWAIFGKVNENMETIAFREKFADWPDSTRLIKVKSQETNSAKQTDLGDLVAFDGKKLAERPLAAPFLLVLEGSNVGRGTQWSEDMDGFIQHFEITTIAVTVWHVLEFDHYKLDLISNGQFHDGDTYVVRWEYRIVATGAKTGARRSTVGRERCAYFFWQGKNSTITEKGASALMTVELDDERGPQVRVLEGKEPPCFLSLFGGKIIVHIGKREEEETNTQGPWKFFCLRNEKINELCLIEIESANTSALRSRSSVILLNVQTGKVFIWHGSKSSPNTRELAQLAVANIQKSNPLEVGLPANISLNITQFEEGSETSEFWSILSGNDRRQYMSLLNDHRYSYDWSIRLFEFTSVPGVIEVTEVKNPSCVEDMFTPYPYLQSDLYNATQPALFLLDNNYEVFVWQGWWPQGDEDIENVHTGSAQSRFVVEKRCILQTALDYCKAKETTKPINAYLVFAGLEPIKFTNLFPFWNVDEVVQELSLKDGKSEDSLVDVREELTRLSLIQYPLKELLERPLPIEVDPLKLETYLCDEEFEEILNMAKEEYYALPVWKQSKLKQDIGLF